ncbi:hypothetical protein [Stigmatella erecta]|uniref:HNH endonuclease n=1 Tax=Stigmatella erecta TaxID=83460 RepID=A0A1I0EKR9_9BACT|nr:hypothetical protein [Stigmatella erecta]SET45280.1 hypothetical protein SAMN05443639_1032 [Stigmatella erecta]
MTEEVKRLTPTPETLRELYLKSGNLCAFPGCTHLMMNEEGTFIGQVCHIAAASPGGERFDPTMTNEDRRHVSNLMLMCYEHHTVTDDVTVYTVEQLRRMKADHERKFANPGEVILERLKDLTTLTQPKPVKNLRRINKVLEWGQLDAELVDQVGWLNQYLEDYRKVPREVRGFLRAVVQRTYRMKDSRVASRDSIWGWSTILISDVRDALGISQRILNERVQQLEAYNLGGFYEMDTPSGEQMGVGIKGVQGWLFWIDIAEFCERAPESLEAIAEHLDFSRLGD